ncbi:unnamed protein product [Ilex paraguariensis]|uniref:Uncharacterized protein n=1 Tax=Ilex paraguariensis TaxID=185542 RepID=A0ABC8UZS5_9AQUA
MKTAAQTTTLCRAQFSARRHNSYGPRRVTSQQGTTAGGDQEHSSGPSSSLCNHTGHRYLCNAVDSDAAGCCAQSYSVPPAHAACLYRVERQTGRIRSALNKVRRKLRQTQNQLTHTILAVTAKELRKRYRNEIYAAKVEAWRTFVSKKSAWGKPYRVLKNKRANKGVPMLTKPDGSRCVSPQESHQSLLESKFGTDTCMRPDINHPLPEGPAPSVTAEQLAGSFESSWAGQYPKLCAEAASPLPSWDTASPVHRLPHLRTLPTTMEAWPRSVSSQSHRRIQHRLTPTRGGSEPGAGSTPRVRKAAARCPVWFPPTPRDRGCRARCFGQDCRLPR